MSILTIFALWNFTTCESINIFLMHGKKTFQSTDCESAFNIKSFYVANSKKFLGRFLALCPSVYLLLRYGAAIQDIGLLFCCEYSL